MTDSDTNDRNDEDATNQGASAGGLRCVDSRGDVWLDAMAGRRGPFGYAFEPLANAIRGAASRCLSTFEPAATDSENNAAGNDSTAVSLLRELVQSEGLRSTESIVLTESSDAAIEAVILGARKFGAPTRYRTVALVGSDHGRTALCRTLSGRPELHQDLGPMMAGFAHVAVGDIETLKRVVDEHTVAVMVSPLAIHDGAKLLDAEFLKKVRAVCDDAGALLIADESRIPLGSSGTPLMTPAIAEIELDAVVLSAGLFGGLSGALLIGSSELTALVESPESGNTLLTAMLEATLTEIGDSDWLGLAVEELREFAVALAERMSEFEFVQDIHANGANIGIELDGPANELIDAAAKEHLRLESAGEHAVWMQLPLVLEAADREELLSRLVTAMQTTGRLASLSSM